MSSKLILSVGFDLVALQSRAKLLVSLGHLVVSARSLKEAVHLFEVGNFDLIVLCRSLSSIEKKRLTCLIRASGSLVPVFSVVQSAERNNPIFKETIVEDDTARFIHSIERVLSRPKRRDIFPNQRRAVASVKVSAGGSVRGLRSFANSK